MKKIILILFAIIYTTNSYSQTFTKTEHLLTFVGNNGYSGWFLTITYNIGNSQENKSDTTFTILTNSAAYEVLREPFVLFTSNSKRDLINFINNLDKILAETPNEASTTIDNFTYSKNSTYLIVTKNDTGRTDTYCYYNSTLSKKIHKPLLNLK